jgi:enoyl-CoA hydratase
VIAAIEGHSVAGGMELALWCDRRVAANYAVFGILNRRFGVPIVDGGTVRLARIAGQGVAMDLILTGRPIGAEEAERNGLVDRVVEPDQALPEAVALAQRIAGFPQAGLRHDRRSLLEQWGLPLNQALENELRWGRKTMAAARRSQAPVALPTARVGAEPESEPTRAGITQTARVVFDVMPQHGWRFRRVAAGVAWTRRAKR